MVSSKLNINHLIIIDYQVAEDNVKAIIQFLNAYNLWNNELYLMGESYAVLFIFIIITFHRGFTSRI